MTKYSAYAAKASPTTSDKLLIDDVADASTPTGMEKVITIGQVTGLVWGGGAFTGEVIIDVGTGDALLLSKDGTKTSAGAIWFNPASGTAGGINMKNTSDGDIYTIIADILGLPASTPAIAGYQGGWVFFSAGSGSGTNQIVAFGNSSSTGPGPAGGCALTAWTNNQVQTLHNTLDDGSTGAMTVAGNVDISTAGKGLAVKEGSNAKQGTLTLNGTTAVVVSNTSVTASSRIFLTIQSPGGTPASPYVSARTAGTSFSVKSTGASDTSVCAYFITEPG